MKIFINAGHGGIDSGAVSKNGNKEKDITRNVAEFLCSMLIAKGYDIEFFQQKKSVNEVVEKERISKSSLFISLHCNSVENNKAGGVEVLYYPNSGVGKTVSEILSKNISEYLEIKNRGAKTRRNLAVLNGTVAPAVLVELAFLSNSNEEKLLVEEPYSFANAIVKGIEEWKK